VLTDGLLDSLNRQAMAGILNGVWKRLLRSSGATWRRAPIRHLMAGVRRHTFFLLVLGTEPLRRRMLSCNDSLHGRDTQFVTNSQVRAAVEC
jgi:hypothetical protein